MASQTLEYPRLLRKNAPVVIHSRSEHRRFLAELEELLRKPSMTEAEGGIANCLAC